MDTATLLKLTLVGSIVLIVLSIGLASPLGTVAEFLRTPRLAAKAMLAMFVAMPLFTLLVTWLLPLDPAVRVTLLALSVSPMPPLLPNKEIKLGAQRSYAIGTLVLASLTSLVAAPLLILLAEQIYDRDVAFGVSAMFMTLAITVAVPLLVATLINRLAPAFAERIARPLGIAGMVVLGLGAIVLLANAGAGIVAATGGGALVAILAMTLFGLAMGHWLGGPVPGNRHALAVATATRHPGVAIALATAALPAALPQIVPAVLLALLAGTVFGLPYGRWAKRTVTA